MFKVPPFHEYISNSLDVIRTWTMCGSRGFLFSGTKFWNSLPNFVRTVTQVCALWHICFNLLTYHSLDYVFSDLLDYDLAFQMDFDFACDLPCNNHRLKSALCKSLDETLRQLLWVPHSESSSRSIWYNSLTLERITLSIVFILVRSDVVNMPDMQWLVG